MYAEARTQVVSWCIAFFVFISAVSKPRAIKLMTKMEADKVIQSSFLFGPSTFQEKIRVRERFISLETLSECE